MAIFSTPMNLRLPRPDQALPGRQTALQVPEQRENVRVLTRRFVQAAHRAGVPVQVWVIDRPEDIRRLLDWGVDGIITDRPDIAVPTVAGYVRATSPATGIRS